MRDLMRHSKDASLPGLVDKSESASKPRRSRDILAPEGEALKIRISLKDGGVREIVFSSARRRFAGDKDDVFTFSTTRGEEEVALRDVDCYWIGMSEADLLEHPLA